jgi:hypothetical protein
VRVSRVRALAPAAVDIVLIGSDPPPLRRLGEEEESLVPVLPLLLRMVLGASDGVILSHKGKRFVVNPPCVLDRSALKAVHGL